MADEISLSTLRSLSSPSLDAASSGGEKNSEASAEASTEASTGTSKKIDWSKPIVSRGFGLDESLYDSSKATLTQYKSGQTFYFFGEYEKAAKKWKPLLDENFSEAQASMGWLYQAGLGVKKNEVKAFSLYMKAAKQNNAIAQNNLGVMYEKGITVDSSPLKARQWYKRSAEQGYRFGQYNYANNLLSQFKDSAPDSTALKKIKTLLKKSANQGVRQASDQLKTLGRQNGG